MLLTILYDNYSSNPGLKTAWGFAAQIEYLDQVILFDTGGDWPTLSANMAGMGIDPAAIQMVVLSHIHGDHTGGLQGLLGTNPGLPVYVPPSILSGMQSQFADAVVTGAEPGHQVGKGLYSTGELRQGVAEQALIVRMEEGLVVITGCAHPGVDRLVERAVALFGDPVILVTGGFHLGSASPQKIQRVISNLKELGVQYVAPCHCTGDQAIAAFAAAYGDDFIPVGVGKVISIPWQGEEAP